MPSRAVIKWITSMILFTIVSSGVIDPAHEESIRGIIELGVTGMVFLGATFVYGYEIIHQLKHPQEKAETPFITFLKNLLNKVWIIEPKTVEVAPVLE